MFLPIGKNSYSRIFFIVFLLSLYLLPFSTGTGGGSFVITFAFPFLILLEVFIIGNFIFRKTKIEYPEDLKLTLICAIVYTFSIFITSMMNKSMAVSFARSVYDFFGFAIFYYIISNSANRHNANLVYQRVCWLFLWSGCLMSFYFIGNFLVAIQSNPIDKVLLEREVGQLLALPWGASNTIAGCLMMPFFVGLDRLLHNQTLKGRDRLITLAMLVTIGMAVLLTQSRNGNATMLLGIIFAGWLTKNLKSTLLTIAAFVGLLAFLAVTFGGQDLSSIFEARLGDQAADVEGFNGRTTLWQVSLAYIFQYPFQPLGYFGMLYEFGHTGHNVFLTTAIERGIVGLMVYLAFLINNFVFCIKKIRDRTLSAVTRSRMTLYSIAMLSILLQLQFEDSNLTGQNIVYQWIFLALMYLSPYCDEADKEEGENTVKVTNVIAFGPRNAKSLQPPRRHRHRHR